MRKNRLKPKPWPGLMAKAGKFICGAFVSTVLIEPPTQPAYAADMWTKANGIMKDVYNKIAAITTVAGIVTAAVALRMMNFSKSGRTVDELRAWLKRISLTAKIIVLCFTALPLALLAIIGIRGK